jgi:hypothetical protein
VGLETIWVCGAVAELAFATGRGRERVRRGAATGRGDGARRRARRDYSAPEHAICARVELGADMQHVSHAPAAPRRTQPALPRTLAGLPSLKRNSNCGALPSIFT